MIQYLERASISPDGTRFVGVYRPAGGPIGLVVMPVAGGSPQWIKTPQPMASGHGIMKWTRDGRAILYSTAERSNLYVHRLAEGTSERLTRFAEDFLLRGELSADGRSLLVTRVAASQEPYLITDFR